MSEELKKALEDILKPANKDKAFSFGYVAGKRKDNNGEGNLVISRRPKTFKVDDVQDEVVKAGTFCHGICFADDAGKSVYFYGNGVKPQIKPIKTIANKLTKKSFDILYPEKEAETKRAEELSKAVDTQTALPPPPQRSVPPTPTTQQQTGTDAAPLAPPQPTAPSTGGTDDKLEKAVLARWQSYKKDTYPKAVKLDTKGLLKEQYDKVEDEIKDSNWADAQKELTVLTRKTELVLSRATQQARFARLKLDPAKLSTGQQLGQGALGTVYRLKNEGKDNASLVIKRTNRGDDKAKQGLQDESDNYALIGDHDNIAKCYGLVKVGTTEGLVMESLDGGSLNKAFDDLNRLKEAGTLSHAEYWGSMQRLFQGTLSGLAHLEKKGFTHNDVKPDNVMFDSKTMQAKLIDIGSASRVGDATGAPTPMYMSPEKIADLSNPVSAEPSQDSYSAGQMLFGQGERGSGPAAGFLFDSDALKARSIPQFLQALSDGAKEYLQKYQRGDPTARVLKPTTPGADAGKAGKYAAGYESAYVDFLEAMMHPDPGKRLKPSEALNHPFLKDPILQGEEAATALSKVVESRKAYLTPDDAKHALEQATKEDDTAKEALAANEAAKSAAAAAQAAAKAATDAQKAADAAQDPLVAVQEGGKALRAAEDAKALATVASEAAAAAAKAAADADTTSAKTAAAAAKQSATDAATASTAAAAAAAAVMNAKPLVALRASVAAELKGFDTIKGKIKLAAKDGEAALLEAEKAEESIEKAKPGAEAVAKPLLDSLRARQEKLETITNRELSYDRMRVVALATNFDALISLLEEDPARSKEVAKDRKSLKKLSKLATQLIVGEGQLTRAIGGLKEVLEEVKASGNKGVPPTAASPANPEKVRKAAEKLASQLPEWETKLDTELGNHGTYCYQTQQLADAVEAALKKARQPGGKAITADLAAKIAKRRDESVNRHQGFQNLTADVEKKVAEFEDVASGGSRKTKGRGKRTAALALAIGDQKTLIALSAIQMKIKRIHNLYLKANEALDDLLDEPELDDLID